MQQTIDYVMNCGIVLTIDRNTFWNLMGVVCLRDTAGIPELTHGTISEEFMRQWAIKSHKSQARLNAAFVSSSIAVRKR